MSSPLIIIGTNAFAEIAYEYFTHDSGYEVVGFSVERDRLPGSEFLGLPVVPFEEIERHFLVGLHHFFVTLGYNNFNRDRTRLYRMAKEKGYQPASYLSSRASIWRNVKIGEHCFIFEDNTVQPFVELGNNVILWSGNHIGHHSKIEDNCFISSHVVVSGFCQVGRNCFIGVNSTISNNLSIANDCLIGAGSNVVGDLTESGIYLGNPARRREC